MRIFFGTGMDDSFINIRLFAILYGIGLDWSRCCLLRVAQQISAILQLSSSGVGDRDGINDSLQNWQVSAHIKHKSLICSFSQKILL